MHFLPFFIILLISFHKISLNIIIPFVINSLKDEEYTPTKFLEDFFLRDFYTTTKMGSSPNQEILTLISTEHHYFILSSNVCERKTINYVNNTNIVKKSGFYLDKATSYNNESFFNSFITNYKDGGVISDTFIFYNSTYLKCQPSTYNNKNVDKNLIDSKVEINSSRIVIEEYNNDKKCIIIGLNSPYYVTTTGVSIFEELKSSSNTFIKDNQFYFKFLNKNEGQLIIGQKPHEYENDNKLTVDNYFQVQSYGDFNFPWVLLFKEIYFINKNEEKILLYVPNIQRVNEILSNVGFVIADDTYKKLIKENYFDDLIKNNICTIEKINVNITTDNLVKCTEYDMISCNKKNFTKDLMKKFPTLYLTHIDYNYTFSLNYNDVFLEKGEKIFFLIVFPYCNKNYWYLGLPFVQKYKFVFNYDAKTIGFYNTDIFEDKNENSESSIFEFKHLRLVIEIIVAIILVVIAFFVAKKIYEQRKTRANELTDDNYDYTAKNDGEEKTGINDSLGM